MLKNYWEADADDLVVTSRQQPEKKRNYWDPEPDFVPPAVGQSGHVASGQVYANPPSGFGLVSGLVGMSYFHTPVIGPSGISSAFIIPGLPSYPVIMSGCIMSGCMAGPLPLDITSS